MAASAGSVSTLCPVAGTVDCDSIISPQTEQCEPAVFPVVVQVAATAGSISTLCPVAETVVCSLVISPHTEHFFPAVSPACVQVAEIAGRSSSLCPNGGIISLKFPPHILHVCSFSPSSVHEAFRLIFHSSK